MNEVGKKIFYLKLNGQVVLVTDERSGATVRNLSLDECFQIYGVLKQYTREELGVIELNYGQYAQDFDECNGYMVNTSTGLLEFTYPNPSNPTEEPIYEAPLSEKIKLLEADNASLKETIDLILTDIIPSLSV